MEKFSKIKRQIKSAMIYPAGDHVLAVAVVAHPYDLRLSPSFEYVRRKWADAPASHRIVIWFSSSFRMGVSHPFGIHGFIVALKKLEKYESGLRLPTALLKLSVAVC